MVLKRTSLNLGLHRRRFWTFTSLAAVCLKTSNRNLRPLSTSVRTVLLCSYTCTFSLVLVVVRVVQLKPSLGLNLKAVSPGGGWPSLRHALTHPDRLAAPPAQEGGCVNQLLMSRRAPLE